MREILPLPPLEPARGYTLMHACLYLDVSPPSIYRLIRNGRLPSRIIGKRRIIPGSELIRFITGQEPILKGDPIEERLSEAGRTGGKAGGLAKARRGQKRAA
jgi:excisionase family DNA binding protein